MWVLSSIVFCASALISPLDSILAGPTYKSTLPPPSTLPPVSTPFRGHVTEPGLVGSFASPGYPGRYPDETFYTYQIGLYPGFAVTLHFTHFDVENCFECMCAAVTIESTTSADKPQTFCEPTLPGKQGYINGTSPMLVKFRSVGYNPGTGFYATYRLEKLPTSSSVTYAQPAETTVYSTTTKPRPSSILLQLLHLQHEARQLQAMANGLDTELTDIIHQLNITATADDEEDTDEAAIGEYLQLAENITADLDHKESHDGQTAFRKYFLRAENITTDFDNNESNREIIVNVSN